MIDAKKLLADLQRLLRSLENDLRQRCEQQPDVDARVRAEYAKAKSGGRTSQDYRVWRDEFITQVGVAWILACVFVRFMEDNGLIETPMLSGPRERLRAARDQHTLYFREHPTHSDREYLEHVFREVGKLPGARELFDERHNPLWTLGVTGDGATKLLEFWQKVDPATGELIRDFTDTNWDTRFLGDLYQDLSKEARKKYALLQTPEFVEEFILDRTLTPAITEFGFEKIRLIDPTCGSGHFLLGAFQRLFDRWQRNEPGTNPRKLVQNTLDSIYGIDLNPYAIAIARFRLLVAALRADSVKRLRDAPGFKINIAVGDSLLHGERPEDQLKMGWQPMAHVYETEDKMELDHILKVGYYHAVVGNPPYIRPDDSALNKAYRERFHSCHMKYSLAVPFMERFFDLAIIGSDGSSAGYVGMITANSFMKREFGKKLVESFIPRWDITHIIDTAKAHIPEHGTPTVILFGRNVPPINNTIRVVSGIKAEPVTPPDPSRGLIWSAIVRQVDIQGSQSDFVSVNDVPRNNFHKHPWNIGGGGIAELTELLQQTSTTILDELADSIGFMTIPGDDDVFVTTQRSTWIRMGISNESIRWLITGETVRDWMLNEPLWCIYPYNDSGDYIGAPTAEKHFWRYRTILRKAPYFGKTKEERGKDWREFAIVVKNKYRTPLSISFSNVTTLNYFVFDRGGKVFNSHSPVIKLPPQASEDDHIAILGLLNSSTACFWMKQTFHNKGGGGIGGGLATEYWEQFYEFDGTKLKKFPIIQNNPSNLSKLLDHLAQQEQAFLPSNLMKQVTPNLKDWRQSKQDAEQALMKMIALQEELDWQCYRLYGLIEEDLTLPLASVPAIKLGERAFEIVLARKMAAGELNTMWFERHRSTPTTEIPSYWPEEYRQIVKRRIDTIEQNNDIHLIERPEYKRRWNVEPWDDQSQRALREWLLNRLEDASYWPREELTSVAKLTDHVRSDREFIQVAEMYRGRFDFDLTKLVDELVRTEAVPFLPILRYKPSGLRHHEVWEKVWELQRKEDAIDAQTSLPAGQPQHLTPQQANRLKAEQVGDIPTPPKLKPGDFLDQTFWRLRGKIDVPKERFISYPHCERDADPTLVIAWAGWNYLQQAQAIAEYYNAVKEREGWSNARLMPLLAGLLELSPWLLQWHNEIDPVYNERMGNFYLNFVEDEARAMGLTLNKIRAWTPQG